MPTKIALSSTVDQLIKKWQRAVAPLRTPNHPALKENELAKRFSKNKGRQDLRQHPKQYDINANLIMDFIATDVPAIMIHYLTQIELDDRETNPKKSFNFLNKINNATQKAKTLLAIAPLLNRCKSSLNEAYVYLDYDTCVPHITSLPLYKKMQWLEWLLLKAMEMLNANTDPNFADIKEEIISYINTRLGNAEKNVSGLTLRLNHYAKKNQFKRLTYKELEAEFDAQEATQEGHHKIKHGVIMNANGNIPHVLIPPIANGNHQPDREEEEEKKAYMQPEVEKELPPPVETPEKDEKEEEQEVEAEEKEIEAKENAIPESIEPKIELAHHLIENNEANEVKNNDIRPIQNDEVDAAETPITLNYHEQLQTLFVPTINEVKPYLSTFILGYLLNFFSNPVEAAEENTAFFSTLQTFLLVGLTGYTFYQHYQSAKIITIAEEEKPEERVLLNPLEHQHLVDQPLPFDINDAQEAPKLADNPLVEAPQDNNLPPLHELKNAEPLLLKNDENPQQLNAGDAEPKPVDNAPIVNPQNPHFQPLEQQKEEPEPLNNKANPLPKVVNAEPKPEDNPPVVIPQNKDIEPPQEPKKAEAIMQAKPQDDKINDNIYPLAEEEKDMATPSAQEKEQFVNALNAYIHAQGNKISNNHNNLLTIVNNKSLLPGHSIFVHPIDKKQAAETLLSFITGRPAIFNEKIIQICKTDSKLRKIIETHEANLFLPAKLINPNKMKRTKMRLIEELEHYADARLKRSLKERKQYDSFLGFSLAKIGTGFDASTKTRAASKLKCLLQNIKELNGEKITFDENEINALTEGDLSDILKKYVSTVTLPHLPRVQGKATNSIPSAQRPNGRL